MVNRVVGLGIAEPATEEALDAALSAMGDDVSCYVSLATEAQPDDSRRVAPRARARARLGVDDIPT